MSLIARVSDGQVGIIERSEKYYKTIFPGNLHLLVPVIDQLFVYELKQKFFKLPNFSVLLVDSFTIDVESSVKYKITEPYKARYEVENKDLELTIERFIIRTLSSMVTKLSLEEAVAKKDEMAITIKKQLEHNSRNWGFRLIYFEIHSMKKSFLAQQEKEKLYDVYKTERGAFMSEKVNLTNPAQAIHHQDDEKATGDAQPMDLNAITETFYKSNQDVTHKIEEIETQMEEMTDEEQKEITRQQLIMFKEHQREMLQLHEKDIKIQQEDLMLQIDQISKMQKELVKKQEELLHRQSELNERKKEIDEPVEG